MKIVTFDPSALKVEFLAARLQAQQLALSVTNGFCRYCGKLWRPWAGSKLDGHSACIVGEDFKRRIGELLRMPTVTYASMANTLGVSISVLRSWNRPRSLGPPGPQMEGSTTK